MLAMHQSLDFVPATLVQVPNDDGLNSGCPLPNRWTGVTILQFFGATKKKLGMVAVAVPRQVAKEQKTRTSRPPRV